VGWSAASWDEYAWVAEQELSWIGGPRLKGTNRYRRPTLKVRSTEVAELATSGVPETVTRVGMIGPFQMPSTLTRATRSLLAVPTTVPTKTIGAALIAAARDVGPLPGVTAHDA